MEYSRIEFCGILLNVTGICLWCITFLYFIRKREKSKKGFFVNQSRKIPRPFDEEIFAQIVKQHSERSFKRISEAIMRERQLLCSFMEKGGLKNLKSISSKPSSNGSEPTHLWKNNEQQYSNLEPIDKYAEAKRLADLGMTTKKILEKTNLPRGEVELVVKLRQKNGRVAGGRPAGLKAYS